MTKGSYLVIEHTEALHVIDVNSGNRRSSAKNQEESALEVNLIAASEIARQLRLRDMGGIIVVDFIDQNKAENRKKLFNLREFVADKLKEHGVKIDHVNHDTFKAKNNFFSYRRSCKLKQNDYGRSISVVRLI